MCLSNAKHKPKTNKRRNKNKQEKKQKQTREETKKTRESNSGYKAKMDLGEAVSVVGMRFQGWFVLRIVHSGQPGNGDGDEDHQQTSDRVFVIGIGILL